MADDVIPYLHDSIKRVQGIDDPDALGVDEIVVENTSFHLERMNDGSIWIGVKYTPDRRLSIQLEASAAGKLSAIVEDESL